MRRRPRPPPRKSAATAATAATNLPDHDGGGGGGDSSRDGRPHKAIPSFLPSFLPVCLSTVRSSVRPSVRPRSSRSFCRVIVLALLTCENFGQSAPAAPLRNESTQISTERNPPSPRYFLHCSTPTAFNLNRMLELLSRAKLQSCFPATFHSLPGMTFH